MTGDDGGRAGPSVRVLLAGVLVVTAPAATLVALYAVATAGGTGVAPVPTPDALVGLYLVELAAFAVFALLLYRLTLAGVRLAGADGSTDDFNKRPCFPGARRAMDTKQIVCQQCVIDRKLLFLVQFGVE
jgi:hypothetical protein